MTKSGREAKEPYRVRAGGIWYWVDPTVPAREIEPGDTVILYSASGDAHVAVLQSRYRAEAAEPVRFAQAGGPFEVPSRDIAALHLAAVDNEQG